MTIELNPAEKIALTVGLDQVRRGDQPTPNVASVCILALGRITGRYDYLAEQPTLETSPEPARKDLQHPDAGPRGDRYPFGDPQ